MGKAAASRATLALVNALLDDLLWRGLIAHSTDLDALGEHLDAGPVKFYVGFDPTAQSLHFGNLVQLLFARRLQEAGHRPYLLVGGATGQIGDPKESGERAMNPKEVVAGWEITDVENELTSQTGRYFIRNKKNQFTNSVKIVNKDFTVDSQVLDYYHPTGNAYFYGATTITGQDYKVYCERGFYDTRKEEGYFMKNATIDYDFKTLKGDSLYFDKKRSFASATNNIVVIDTINKTIVKGHYGEIHKAKDSMFITKKPVIISLIEKDSMYMHGKKILVTGKETKRTIRVFPDARIFKSDMQAKCDSIHSEEFSGLTQLIGKPVAWTGESQMTGDSIHLIANTKTEQLDSLKVFNNALVVEKDTLGDGYNQVKGKVLYGKFRKNQLKQIDFVQNTESIYYVYNDKKEMVGINKLTCSHIKLYLDDQQQVEKVVFITQPVGDLYPEDKLDKNERKFREFIWRGDERIHSKEEIFSEEEKNPELIKIQGGKTPEENDLDEMQKMQKLQESEPTKEL